MRKLLILLLIPISCTAQWSVPNDFTLQEALNGGNGQIKGGQTVTIEPGVYDPVKVTKKFSSTVKFIAKDGMILKGSPEHDASDAKGLVWVAGGENIKFINWHLHGNNPYRDSRLDTYTGISHGFGLYSGENIDIEQCTVENTGGSGVYLASSCKNVNILNNIFKYNGYYSESLGRYGHRNLYIQSWPDSYCNIKGNLLLKGLNYNVQIWHQDGDATSKLVGVSLEDNTVICLEETALHYGGYNKASKGKIIRNSIYYVGYGPGIRVGYTTHADQNMNFDFDVIGNVLQNSNLRVVNPRNYKGEDDIYISDNFINGNLQIHTWKDEDITPIISKWTGNNIMYDQSDFMWVDYHNPGTGVVAKSNIRTSLKGYMKEGSYVKGAYDYGLHESNASVKSSGNIIKITDQGNRKIVSVHNFEGLSEIKLNLEGNVKIEDAENPGVTIYEGPGSEAKVRTDLTGLEQMFGDLPTPPKTASDYGVFIVYPSETQAPDVPVVVVPPTLDYVTQKDLNDLYNLLIKHNDSLYALIELNLSSLGLKIENEAGKNLEQIIKNRDSIKDHKIIVE